MNFKERFGTYKNSIFDAFGAGKHQEAIQLFRELIRLDADLEKKYKTKLISIEWRYETHNANKDISDTQAGDNSAITDLTVLLDEISLENIDNYRKEDASILNELPGLPSTYPLKVFISYSHKDEDWKKDLIEHFSALTQAGKIRIWHDRMINPGDVWDTEIGLALQQSDLILLLLSSNFMASKYIWSNELPKAIARHNSGEAKVIPIFTRPVDIEETEFNKLQGLPRDKKWLASQDRDVGLFSVVSELRLIIKNWKQ